MKAETLIEKVKQGDLEDENGQISREDFVALSLHNNLLKIRQRKLQEIRKKSKSQNSQKKNSDHSETPTSCFCFKSSATEFGQLNT